MMGGGVGGTPVLGDGKEVGVLGDGVGVGDGSTGAGSMSLSALTLPSRCLTQRVTLFKRRPRWVSLP